MQGQGRIIGVAHWEYDGKSFDIPRWQTNTENLFAAWVYSTARRRLQAERRELGEEEYREQMNSLRRDRDAHLYDWGSAIVGQSWRSEQGGRHLVYLTLSALDKAVTPKWVDDLAGDRQAWGDLWDVLVELNFPPSQPAPTTEGAEAGATS